MIYKQSIQCVNCAKPIGFALYKGWTPLVYCYGCEAVVVHKEEMREEEHERKNRRIPKDTAASHVGRMIALTGERRC